MAGIDPRTTEAAELTKKALNQVADDLTSLTGRDEVRITAGYLRLAAHMVPRAGIKYRGGSAAQPSDAGNCRCRDKNPH